MNEKIDQDFVSKDASSGFWRRRWMRLALIWGVWTFIGIVFTLQSYFTSFRSEKPTPLFDSLYVQMTWSYLWALATPLVLWAATRLPIERNNWMRSALLHVPLSICSAFSSPRLATSFSGFTGAGAWEGPFHSKEWADLSSRTSAKESASIC